MKVTLTILSIAAIVAAGVLFALFMADVSRLGGDALSGQVVDGHWFVGEHGRATEVSEADWTRNRDLAVGTFVAFPLGMLSFFYLLLAVIAPRVIFRAPADDRDARVRDVAASGPVIATSKGGGSFKWFGVGKGLLRADVHPGGLVVRARFIGSVAVRVSEMTAVRERRSVLQHAVTVEHSSPHVVSPIHLALRRDAAFVDALKRIGVATS
jgi:hypothetical protein